MLSTKAAVSAAAVVLAGAVAAHGSILTQWNFNGPTGINNSPNPSVGMGSATPVGMNGGLNNADIGNTTGSSDPAAPNQHWRVRGSQTNGWSGTVELKSGARFNVPTTGQQDIVVAMDIFATDGSPRHAQFQYTTDGAAFTSFGGLLDFGSNNDAWTNGLSFDLSSIAAVENNPLFGFQIVSAFSPVEFTNANGLQPANTAFQRADQELGVYTGAAGNYRFDMVTVSGTVIPEPSALGLLGLGLAMLGRRGR